MSKLLRLNLQSFGLPGCVKQEVIMLYTVLSGGFVLYGASDQVPYFSEAFGGPPGCGGLGVRAATYAYVLEPQC